MEGDIIPPVTGDITAADTGLRIEEDIIEIRGLIISMELIGDKWF